MMSASERSSRAAVDAVIEGASAVVHASSGRWLSAVAASLRCVERAIACRVWGELSRRGADARPVGPVEVVRASRDPGSVEWN